MSDWTTAGTLALAGVVVLYIWRQALARRTAYPLPPGPPGLPWAGNVIGINTSAPWITYAEWTRTYGRLQTCSVLQRLLQPLFMQATSFIPGCWERISSSSIRRRPQRSCSRTGPGTIQTVHTSLPTNCQLLVSLLNTELNPLFKEWTVFQFHSVALW